VLTFVSLPTRPTGFTPASSVAALPGALHRPPPDEGGRYRDDPYENDRYRGGYDDDHDRYYQSRAHRHYSSTDPYYDNPAHARPGYGRRYEHRDSEDFDRRARERESHRAPSPRGGGSRSLSHRHGGSRSRSPPALATHGKASSPAAAGSQAPTSKEAVAAEKPSTVPEEDKDKGRNATNKPLSVPEPELAAKEENPKAEDGTAKSALANAPAAGNGKNETRSVGLMALAFSLHSLSR